MRKYSRLLSLVLLIATLFSLTSVYAFADGDVVFTDDDTNTNGGLTISQYSSSRTGESSSSNTGSSNTSDTAGSESGSYVLTEDSEKAALAYFSSEKMAEENPIVYENAEYIVYVRKNMDELEQTNPAAVDTAYMLFGEEIMEMSFEDTTKTVSEIDGLKLQKASLQKVIDALEMPIEDGNQESFTIATDALHAAVEAYRDYEAYRGDFKGLDYDYTNGVSEADGITSASTALQKANAEMESIEARIAKLESGNNDNSNVEENDTKDDAVTSNATENQEESVTPNAASPANQEKNNENGSTEEPENGSTEESKDENKNEVDGSNPVAMAVSPFEMFSNLFAVPALTSYTVDQIRGNKVTIDNPIEICAVNGWTLTVPLNNATITTKEDFYAFVITSGDVVLTATSMEACTVYGKLIEVTDGATVTLENFTNENYSDDASVSVNGGTLIIGNSDIISYNSSAIKVSDGELILNGGNKIHSEEEEIPAILVSGGKVTVDQTGGLESDISNTTSNGCAMQINNGAAVTANGNAKFSGYNGIEIVSGTLAVNDNVMIEAIGHGKDYSAIRNLGGEVYVASGSLDAAYGRAIYTADGATTRLASESSIIKYATAYSSEGYYETGLITVNDIAVTDISAVNDILDGTKKSTDFDLDETLVIKFLGDVNAKETLKVPANVSVSINGNGHRLICGETSNFHAIEVIGSAYIDNLGIEASPNNLCIYVYNDANGAGYVNVGSGVDAAAGKCALYVEAQTGGTGTPTASVNGMEMNTSYGIYASDGTLVSVNDCINNSQYPVMAVGTTVSKVGCLKIMGGHFKTKGKVVDYLVNNSSLSETTENGYYVVTMDTTPTVAIINGTTGTDSDGIPYVVYDKANPKYITFNVDPKVTTITAVPINGGDSMNVFQSIDGQGVEGDIVIKIDDFQNNLKCGVYDLQFQFKNGYNMSGKLHLYVLPETLKLVARSDYKDFWVTEKTTESEWIKELETSVTSYTVGSNAYIYAMTSELPDKIGVSSDPNGDQVTWFANYESVQSDPSWIFKLGNNYYILLDATVLDQLSAGQNYVFLDYDGAIKRVDLKIVNNNVTISPTSTSVFGTNMNAVFTVKPDFVNAYVDGELVPTEFLKYDTKTFKLTINGEYLNQLESGDHLLEVETSKGWLSASIHTGVGLRPIDVDYHVYGGSKALAFEASDMIDTTAGIYIGKNNPTKVDSTLIYFYDNDTKFTLSPSYLNRLALGTYYISAYVWNGEDYEYTSTTFRIVSASSAAYNPSTGDTFNAVLWIVIAAVAAVVIVVILVPALKKRKLAKVPTEEKVVEEVKEKASEDTEKKE